jgi:hypothetical protein
MASVPAVTAQVHVLLCHPHHRRPDEPRDCQVEPRPGRDQDPVAQRAQEPQQVGVGEEAEPLVASVVAVDEHARPVSRPRAHGPAGRRQWTVIVGRRHAGQVGQHPDTQRGVEGERRLLAVPEDADDLDIVVGREVARHVQRRLDGAAGPVGVGDQIADDHGVGSTS